MFPADDPISWHPEVQRRGNFEEKRPETHRRAWRFIVRKRRFGREIIRETRTHVAAVRTDDQCSVPGVTTVRSASGTGRGPIKVSSAGSSSRSAINAMIRITTR